MKSTTSLAAKYFTATALKSLVTDYQAGVLTEFVALLNPSDDEMRCRDLRPRVQALPQELQDRILDLILQEDGRFSGAIKHFTRDRATAGENNSTTTKFVKVTEGYRHPLALSINSYIRHSFAATYYDNAVVQLEWNELSLWMYSLNPGHLSLLREVRLNMYPELRLSRPAAVDYCRLCFKMLKREGVRIDGEVFKMTYMDWGTGRWDMVCAGG